MISDPAPATAREAELQGEIDFLRRQIAANSGAHRMALEDSREELADAQESVRQARAAERRRAALLDLGDRLRDGRDPTAMAVIAAEAVGYALGVCRVGYGTVAAGSEVAIVERDWTAPGHPGAAGAHRLDDDGPFAEDLGRGDTVVVADVARDDRTAATAPSLLALSTAALIRHPVVEGGRTVAIVSVDAAAPRDWTPEEVAFVRDVAERTRGAIERRRAEQALFDLAASLERQVEERTRERDRLWQLSREPFLIADEAGRWLRVNPVWTEILGWTESELVGRTSEWMEHPDDRAGTRQEIRTLADGTTTLRFENRFRDREGHYHWFLWTAVPAEGLMFCVARDVTLEKEQAAERARLEEQLRQSQKMEAVGQLTGGIAHDFNNLLTGITGALDLLQRRLAQGRTSDVDRFIDLAMGSAKRAAALTHRLLAFSRRQPLDSKPVDGNRLVLSMEDLLRRTLGETITLEVDLAMELWPTFCDPHQLENALLNLCINGRDAMPDGGRLTIATGNTVLDERAARERDMAPGHYVTFCIADTGTGMPPEIIARVFDPFFTTKPIGRGTGLGLSMIYGFARQSGGQVRIDSEVGRGTAMRIHLPRYGGEAEMESGEGARAAPPAARGETVLVVDDEPTVRTLVAEVLGELGYALIEAADGPAGVAVLRSNVRVDLLVTDVGLPGGMNGRQVADAARLLRPDLKVLFITGYADNAAVGGDDLEPGMHLLTKPFDMDALGFKIRAIIGER